MYKTKDKWLPELMVAAQTSFRHIYLDRFMPVKEKADRERAEGRRKEITLKSVVLT